MNKKFRFNLETVTSICITVAVIGILLFAGFLVIESMNNSLEQYAVVECTKMNGTLILYPPIKQDLDFYEEKKSGYFCKLQNGTEIGIFANLTSLKN